MQWGWPRVPCPPWGWAGTLVPASVCPCPWPGAVPRRAAEHPRPRSPGSPARTRGGFPQPRGRRLPARLLPAGRGFRRDRRVLLVLCLPRPSRHPVVWGCRPCPSAPLPPRRLWVTPRGPKVGNISTWAEPPPLTQPRRLPLLLFAPSPLLCHRPVPSHCCWAQREPRGGPWHHQAPRVPPSSCRPLPPGHEGSAVAVPGVPGPTQPAAGCDAVGDPLLPALPGRGTAGERLPL